MDGPNDAQAPLATGKRQQRQQAAMFQIEAKGDCHTATTSLLQAQTVIETSTASQATEQIWQWDQTFIPALLLICANAQNFAQNTMPTALKEQFNTNPAEILTSMPGSLVGPGDHQHHTTGVFSWSCNAVGGLAKPMFDHIGNAAGL